MTDRTPDSISMDRPETNSFDELIVVPKYGAPHPLAGAKIKPSGEPGVYSVSFVMMTPGRESHYTDINLTALFESGESLLLIGGNTNMVKVELFNESSSTELQVYPATDGTLGRIVIQVDANDYRDAYKKSADLVFSFISAISFTYDIPLTWKVVEIRELRTQLVAYIVGMIGKQRAVAPQLFPYHRSTPEVRTLLSIYREAVNCNNEFYRLLCFYKIIEGVSNFRVNRGKERRALGQDYREPGERIPKQLEEVEGVPTGHLRHFRPHLGEKFNLVRGKYRKEFRNALAHVDPNLPILSYDSQEDLRKCIDAGIIMRYISRTMLMNEWKEGRKPLKVLNKSASVISRIHA